MDGTVSAHAVEWFNRWIGQPQLTAMSDLPQ
jgi:hypothetical protein